MLKKFISGIVFGLGFSISVAVALTVWFNFALPKSFQTEPVVVSSSSSNTIKVKNEFEYINNFSDLPLDQKIEKSTAILVTNIIKDDTGLYKVVVSEILKKKDGVELFYKVGDEYDDYSDYNQYENEGRHIPKGFIVFMTDNPASMRFSTSHSGNRVGSLGGISMALLREKCNP